jgi:hypothetical protein
VQRERGEPYRVISDIQIESLENRGNFDCLIWNDSSLYHIP